MCVFIYLYLLVYLFVYVCILLLVFVEIFICMYIFISISPIELYRLTLANSSDEEKKSRSLRKGSQKEAQTRARAPHGAPTISKGYPKGYTKEMWFSIVVSLTRRKASHKRPKAAERHQVKTHKK